MRGVNSEIEVHCPLQWRLLWFSSPTNFNHKFVNKRTKMKNSGKSQPSDRVIVCSAHDKEWDLKEEMQGRDVDDEKIAKLTATDEEAKRVRANN